MVKEYRSGTDDNLKSLVKIRRILDCFSMRQRSLSLAEICEETGYPKSTAHRLVASMRAVGFLDQDRERDRYRLGLKLFEYGSIALANLDLHREALHEIESLRRTTSHGVHLAVFDGHQAVVIHRSEPLSTTSAPLHLLENAPIHCTSVGKAILAFQDEEKVRRVIDAGLEQYTDATIVSEPMLREELSRIRARGYAIDDGEHRPGLRCVGAPIRDQYGKVIASISVSAPAWQISLGDVDQLSKIVIHHADRISARLGHVPGTGG